jgi:hypothetical protein
VGKHEDESLESIQRRLDILRFMRKDDMLPRLGSKLRYVITRKGEK